MVSASVRNSRLWGTGAVALTLLAIAGWQASAQDRASTKKSTEEKKPAENKITTFVSYPQVKVINDQIEAEWKANNLKPSDRCSDFEFIRRASLDIIGRIATPQEIKVYLD